MSWIDYSLLAYVGPDTMLPVASALAAIIGALLVCWRFVAGSVTKAVRCVLRMPKPAEATTDVSTADELK